MKYKLLLCLLLSVLSISATGQISGTVKSDGVNIHFREYGKGTPIVLLSGGPGQSSNALLPIVEKLKNDYRVILVDQRGTGKSKLENLDETTITLEKYVEDINNVRKALKFNNWIVLGHSWGGGLAMALTAKYPKGTSKLILVGSIGIDAEFLKYAFDNLNYTKDDRDNLAYWSDPKVRAKNLERATYEMYRALIPSRVYDLTVRNKIMENYTHEPNSLEIGPMGFRHLAKINYDFKPQLKKFQNPTLIVQGRQGFLGGWTAIKILQTIPKSEIHFIEKCGHFPFVEHPSEFFNILKDFLTNKRV